MGPIETEIRDIAASGVPWSEGACWSSSGQGFYFLLGAARSVGFVDRFNPYHGCVTDAERAGAWPDVLSEAIEAAEALGL